jgi:hypothetical protein
MHLLKWQYQKDKRTNSWRYTIIEHRDRLEVAFRDSPSFKRYFNEILEKCYQKARRFEFQPSSSKVWSFTRYSIPLVKKHCCKN